MHTWHIHRHGEIGGFMFNSYLCSTASFSVQMLLHFNLLYSYLQDPKSFQYKRNSATGLLGPFIVKYVVTDSLGGTGSAQRSVYVSEGCPGGTVRCNDRECSQTGAFLHSPSKVARIISYTMRPFRFHNAFFLALA
jgi:hypothetical protein